MNEAEREKRNAQARLIIKNIRKGDVDSEFADMVNMSDKAREPADEMRKTSEAAMEELAAQLPVYRWIESIPGAGALGLATIVAEAGIVSTDPDLPGEDGNFPNVAKLWNRLGYAPYDGHAGSTWKRATWRPRALTSEEWVEHPFSGSRYALMHQIATFLWMKQWIGKAKTTSGEGEPTGPYGEVYFARRRHTLITHPDWSDGHRHSDALRITMKAFLKDLWVQWNKQSTNVVELPEAKPATRKRKAA